MDLEDFIAETVTSIARGIVKGQADANVGDYVAPLIKGEKRQDFGTFHLKNDDNSQATIIEFDIAIGVSAAREAGGSVSGKARLFVVDVEFGGEGAGSTERSSSHRIKFAVPLTIPVKGARR